MKKTTILALSISILLLGGCGNNADPEAEAADTLTTEASADTDFPKN